MNRHVSLFGVKLSLYDLQEICEIIEKEIHSGRRRIHITGVNTETIVKAQYDSLLRESILQSDIVNIDNYVNRKKRISN